MDNESARLLVRLGGMTRNLKDKGLDEGASTRLLINAGKLMVSGIDPKTACTAAITQTLSDEREMQSSMAEMVGSLF